MKTAETGCTMEWELSTSKQKAGRTRKTGTII